MIAAHRQHGGHLFHRHFIRVVEVNVIFGPRDQGDGFGDGGIHLGDLLGIDVDEGHQHRNAVQQLIGILVDVVHGLLQDFDQRGAVDVDDHILIPEIGHVQKHRSQGAAERKIIIGPGILFIRLIAGGVPGIDDETLPGMQLIPLAPCFIIAPAGGDIMDEIKAADGRAVSMAGLAFFPAEMAEVEILVGNIFQGRMAMEGTLGHGFHSFSEEQGEVGGRCGGNGCNKLE